VNAVGRANVSPGAATLVGPHPALLDLAAGRELPKVNDPVNLLRSALVHGMAGLLLSEVERTSPPWNRLALPALTARRDAVVAWHRRLWEELVELSLLFDDAGIDVAIAKGIAAEAQWYDEVGQRPASDLDLLLSPAQVHQIDDIVAMLEPTHPLLGKVRRFAASGYLDSIDLEHRGVPIDLHWDILKLGVPSRAQAMMWERTVPFALPDGRAIRTLDSESAFVHFLVHVNKDRFRRVLGFVDPTRIRTRDQLDLTVVQRLARADGIEASVGASWQVIEETLRLDRDAALGGGPLRTAVWHVAWRPAVRLRATESTIRFRHRQWLLAFLARGRALEALRSWLKRTFPPRDLVAYLHSAYARRWGGEPVSASDRSRLWSLTVGRFQASLGRRHRLTEPRAPRPTA
jgi:Uncharacterised nucleotidyltransferase